MKTVTVRIPVAVGEDGSWNIEGCVSYHSPKRMLANLSLQDGDHIVWITAEVPVPEPTEVKGRVEG